MIPTLLHCLFRLHRPGRWQDDWMDWHWYCRTCHPGMAHSLVWPSPPGGPRAA
jgi:hypothetical protein